MTKPLIIAIGAAVLATTSAAAANQNTVALPSEEDSVLGGSEYTKLPETWELVYDVAMSPYVDDYKRCLEHTNLILDGTPNVEQQHRAAIPRCAGVREKAIEESNAAVARRGRTASMPPSAVIEAFKALGYIHIERGRNIDDQYKLQRRAAEERRLAYEAEIAQRDAALRALSPYAETTDTPPKETSNAINQ
jgi:hypothetical protein